MVNPKKQAFPSEFHFQQMNNKREEIVNNFNHFGC
jgi:hypothetical protein